MSFHRWNGDRSKIGLDSLKRSDAGAFDFDWDGFLFDRAAQRTISTLSESYIPATDTINGAGLTEQISPLRQLPPSNDPNHDLLMQSMPYYGSELQPSEVPAGTQTDAPVAGPGGTTAAVALSGNAD